MRVIGSTMTGLALSDSDVNLDAYMDSVNGVSRECRLSRLPAEADAANSSAFVDPYKKGFGSLLPEIYEILKPYVKEDDDCDADAPSDAKSTEHSGDANSPPPFPSAMKRLVIFLQSLTLS